MRVTIEGSSATPTDRLAPGKRATVEYTDEVRKLIAIGGAHIVERHVDAPVLEERVWTPGDPPILPEVPESAYPADSTPLDPVDTADELGGEAPRQNASTETWRQFVTSLGIEVDEKWTRSDMIAAYENRDGE